MKASSQYGRFGSGKAVLRVEDESLLTGRGSFADDVNAPGQAYVLFLRSTYPHARIVAIDTSAAAKMPGVIATVTGHELAKAGVKPLPTSADFRRADGSATAAPPRYAMAVDTVRFVGEAVAAVVAETREQARDALEAIQIEYEPLPIVIDPLAAVSPGSPLVWPAATSNIAAEIRHGDVAAATKAFDSAAHVVALDLVNQRLAPCPIEPRAVLASYDAKDDRFTLRVSSQTPTGLRDTLCDMLSVGHDKVRVLVGDVGGGFGMKTGLYPEDAVLAYCARKVGRPLKWSAERIDELLAASHGRDVTSKAELALDASGRVQALRVSSLANLGAYATPAGVVIQLLIGPWVSTSIYDIPLIDVRIRGVLTHTSPTGAYRGAGRPEAIYLIERLMDAAARKLELDPAELRRRNSAGSSFSLRAAASISRSIR